MKNAIWLGSLLMLLTTASTALAETVTMTVRTSRQGDIQGGVGGSRAVRGGGGTMVCSSYESLVVVPRDAASGAGSGRPQIDPIRCVKRLDRASPLLLNAMLSNDSAEVTFSFSQPSPTGIEAVVYTVSLRDAQIAAIRQFTDPAGLAQEEILFNYQQATVTFTPSGGAGVTGEIRR